MGLSKEHADDVAQAIRKTADYIAADVPEDADLDDWCELVLDANRLEDHGKAEPAALASFRALSYEAQCGFARPLLRRMW